MSPSPGTWPGCLPASITWRTCGTRTGSGSSRTSTAASTPRPGSSPATTCCCELAGGIAPASTPYTLRHNYATRTLMRWVEEGKDLEAWLPYLAAYMGHQKYSSTAWYVHLLPERLAATGLTSAAGIIPAVTS